MNEFFLIDLVRTMHYENPPYYGNGKRFQANYTVNDGGKIYFNIPHSLLDIYSQNNVPYVMYPSPQHLASDSSNVPFLTPPNSNGSTETSLGSTPVLKTIPVAVPIYNYWPPGYFNVMLYPMTPEQVMEQEATKMKEFHDANNGNGLI